MNENNKIPKTDKFGNRLHYKTGLYVSKTGNFFIGGGGNYSHIYRNAGQKPYIKAKGNTYNVEDLVTDCYLPKPKGHYVIRHKDGNLDNCDVSNLEWVPAVYTFNTDASTKIKINGIEITVTSERQIKFYADKLCLDPKYASQLIKQASGRMAGDWIQDRVILEAKLLLLDGNHNVQQVADALNFTSQSFFGKYFKNATGMSPKAYKESM